MNQVVKSVRSWKLPSRTNRSDESKLCAVDSRISASGCRACVGLCRCFKNQTAKHLEDSSLPCFHCVRVTEVFQVLMPMSKTPPAKCLLNCPMFSCRSKLPWMVQQALHTFSETSKVPPLGGMFCATRRRFSQRAPFPPWSKTNQADPVVF